MGFSLGGILKSIVNPMSLAQLAMGPAGWASILAKAVMSAVAQQVIQKLGDKLGLPPQITALAQQAFSAASGGAGGASNLKDVVANFAKDTGMSLVEQASFGRKMDRMVDDSAEKIIEAAQEGAKRAKLSTKESKGSWLREIAEAMAQIMDSKIAEMKGLAQAYDTEKASETAKNQNASMSKTKINSGDVKSKSTQIMTDLQVATQEFSYIMNSTTNMIKTIGEGLSTVARKG